MLIWTANKLNSGLSSSCRKRSRSFQRRSSYGDSHDRKGVQPGFRQKERKRLARTRSMKFLKGTHREGYVVRSMFDILLFDMTISKGNSSWGGLSLPKVFTIPQELKNMKNAPRHWSHPWSPPSLRGGDGELFGFGGSASTSSFFSKEAWSSRRSTEGFARGDSGVGSPIVNKRKGKTNLVQLNDLMKFSKYQEIWVEQGSLETLQMGFLEALVTKRGWAAHRFSTAYLPDMMLINSARSSRWPSRIHN